jgi:hypothetical protein
MRLTQRQRRTVATGAMVAAVAGTLAVASIVSRQFFEGPSRTVAPHHPQVDAGLAMPALYRVAAVEGAVESLHNGQWYVVQAGDLLPLQDVIRTNKGATAILRRGGTEVEVREDVDIRLERLAADSSFALLRGGSVIANVEDANAQVEITAAGTRAVNKGMARFVAKLRPDGSVVVATAKGEVLFAARGKEVNITAGHESTARPGQVPDDPEPIPEELLLSVIWPEIEHAEPKAPVTGRVRPSSQVRVNGVAAEVHSDGRFVSSVPLNVGPNKVEVQAEDVLGHKKVVNRVIRRPAPSPVLEPTDEELWKR